MFENLEKRTGIKMKENAQIPKQEFVPKHYSIFSDIIYFIKYFKKYEPVVLYFSILEIILSAIVPLTGIYLPKIAIDLITKEATIQEAVTILVSFTLLMAAVCTLKTAAASGKYNYYNAQRDQFVGFLFLKTLKIPYKYTETGDVKKVYWKAFDALYSGDWSALSRMVTGTIGISINILCFLLYSTVIGTLDLWLLLVLDALAFALRKGREERLHRRGVPDRGIALRAILRHAGDAGGHFRLCRPVELLDELPVRHSPQPHSLLVNGLLRRGAPTVFLFTHGRLPPKSSLLLGVVRGCSGRYSPGSLPFATIFSAPLVRGIRKPPCSMETKAGALRTLCVRRGRACSRKPL